MKYSLPTITSKRAMALLAASALTLAACGSDDPAAAPEPDEVAMMGAFGPACGAIPSDGEGSLAGMADDNAATAASNNPLLTTLVTAVGEAGLGDTLNGPGPFTIFAPTNDAFAALPEGALEAVLADKDLLTTVLTNHVIGADLDAEALGAGSQTSLEGSTLEFNAEGTSVNGIDIICSNVPVGNGTVHIVGEVVLPQVALDALAGGDGEMEEDGEMGESEMEEGEMEESMGDTFGPACSAIPSDGEGSLAGMADDNAATAASNNPLLTTLVTAVGEAGLGDTLNGPGPFTIFAPTNDAFAALPEGALEAVLADKDLLTTVLTNHVVSGNFKAADLGSAATETALSTEELSFNAEGTVVNDINVICSNVPVGNGTVHIVDQVILPQAALDALAG